MNTNKEVKLDLERLQEITLMVYSSMSCFELASNKKKLVKILESIFDFDRKQNEFDWTFVKPFYNYCKDSLWTLRIFCIFMQKLFYIFHCEDYELLMKITFMYDLVIEKYQTLNICNICAELNFPKHYLSEEILDGRSILENINHNINFDRYKFTNREAYSEKTTCAVYEGDYIYLKFLMKYGLSYFEVDEFDAARYELGMLFANYGYLKGLRENNLGMEDRSDFITSSSRLLFEDVENQNFKRTILIIRSMRICFRKSLGDRKCPDYIKCLKLCFLTVTEPEISTKDVENFLHLNFRNDKPFINEVSSIFKEVFPESPVSPSPRSLKHLCRCAVRDYIPKIPLLPGTVSKLSIPREVKDYLLYLYD